jgi:hypothetical protein
VVLVKNGHADSKRSQENAIARSIAIALGGATQRADLPGAPDNTVDFLLTTPMGVEALEVTSLINGVAAGFWKAADRHSPSPPGLTRAWMLCVAPQVARVVRIAKLAPPLLAQLEARGELRFDTREMARSQAELWWAMSVRRGYAIEAEPQLLFSSSTVGALGADSVVAPAAEQAMRPDNVKKLLASNAVRRHVGVWIDRSIDAWFAMSETLPLRTPSLVEGIDVLWLGKGLTTNDGIQELWSCDAAAGWWRHPAACEPVTDP